MSIPKVRCRMNRTERLLGRLPSPVRRALLIGWVGNAIRGLNWLTGGIVLAAVASGMAGVWEWWVAWPLIPQIGFVVGVMILVAAVVGSVASAFEDHLAGKRRLPIGVQAHGMSHGWRPWGVHQVNVLTFQTLILTNRGDQDMSVELGVLPFGGGVLHKYEDRVTVPTGGQGVTLRDVEFSVTFWPANKEKPSLPDSDVVILVKDHVSGRSARFDMVELFGW